MGLDFAHLVANGYCIVDDDEWYSMLRDASDVISSWFENSSLQQKQVAASSALDIAAGRGRGYFALPAKEVIEATSAWECSGVRVDLRLAAKTTYTALQRTAIATLNSILTNSNGFKVTPQQLQELLGQHHPTMQQQHSSSILHINKYRQTAAEVTAAASSSQGSLAMLGSEAHVDKGLLTVIHSTGPGLQVFSRDGCWVPVTPGPGQLVILVGHTLSYMTAGRLPAALHRVVVDPQPPPAAAAAAGGSRNSSSRLSLCFKLLAAPDALLSPAKITGMSAAALPERFRCPKTAQQLISDFDATHVSIHSQAHTTLEQQHQQVVQGPVSASAAAAAAAAAGSGAPKRPADSLDTLHKRACVQPEPALAGYLTRQQQRQQQQQGEHKVLRIVCRILKCDEPYGYLDVAVKIHPTHRLKKLVTACAAYLDGDAHDWRFVYDGSRFDLNFTPDYYGLRDGDIVDVFPQQAGD